MLRRTADSPRRPWPLALEEPAAQDGHRLGLVLDLAFLVLDGHDSPEGMCVIRTAIRGVTDCA